MEHIINSILFTGVLLICYIGWLFWRMSNLIFSLWKRVDEIEFSIRADILRLANLIVDHTKPIIRNKEDDDCDRQTRH